jgi:NADH:ubiquinone oxidoreductase subunit D
MGKEQVRKIETVKPKPAVKGSNDGLASALLRIDELEESMTVLKGQMETLLNQE